MNQYILIVHRLDDQILVYGPFDTPANAHVWANNFPGQRTVVDSLIAPKYNAD